MANPRTIWQKATDNLLSAATITNPTNSPASGYGVSDLYNGNPAFGLHLTANTSFYILIDHGSGSKKAVKLVGFHNTNFDPSLTIVVQQNDTDSWGGPSVNSSVTTPALNDDGFRTDFAWLAASNSTTYRYTRIGCASSNTAAWIIGQLWVSDTVRYFPGTGQINQGVAISRVRAVVEHVTPTPYNVSLRYPSPSRVTLISGSTLGTKAEVEALRDGWFSLSGGAAKPTCFLLDDTAVMPTSNECWFGIVNTEEMAATQESGGQYTADIKFRTLSYGPGW